MSNTPCTNPAEDTLNVLGDDGTTYYVCREHCEEGWALIYRHEGNGLVEGTIFDISPTPTDANCAIEDVRDDYPSNDLNADKFIVVLDDGETYSTLEGSAVYSVPVDADDETIQQLISEGTGRVGTFGPEPPPRFRPYA